MTEKSVSNRLKNIALGLPQTSEEPHFEKTSYRVKNKIFATLSTDERTATLKLTEVDQAVFVSIGKGGIYPVPNKWGKQGWTIVELGNLNNELLEDVIVTAFCTVAPKKLAAEVRPNHV